VIGVEDAQRGLRMGLGAAAVAGGGVALGGAPPARRRFFGDRQVSDVGRGEAAYHVAVRIPLATALAEEVLFRGVLLAMLRQRRPPVAAVLWTSMLFGAWHVLPTIDHYQGNPASDLVADPGRGRRLAVLATALSTTGAGGVFAWLRLRSGGVLAPVLAHTAINVSAYLAGRLVVNRQGRSGRGRVTDPDRVRGLARWQNPVVASPAARAARTRALPPDRGDRRGRLRGRGRRRLARGGLRAER
jgi:hypothetical protein